MSKRGSASKCLNRNDLCHKCGKPGHLIKDCPMHKVEYKHYVKVGGHKDRTRARVPEKSTRRAVASYVVKQAFTALKYSSSEYDESVHPEDTYIMA